MWAVYLTYTVTHTLIFICILTADDTLKPVFSGRSKKKTKIGFQDRLLLNAGQKYAMGSILQSIRPSFGYHLLLRALF